MIKKAVKIILLIISVFILLSLIPACMSADAMISGSGSDEDIQDSGETVMEAGDEAGKDPGGSVTGQETVVSIFIDKDIPFKMWVSINQILREVFLGFETISYRIVFDRDEADIFFELCRFSGEDQNLEEPFYYVPVVSFFSMIEDITYGELEDIWKGSKNTVMDITGEEIPVKLVVMENDVTSLRKILGEESPAGIRVVKSYDLYDSLTEDESTIGIIPFDLIKPEIKVLSLDNNSVLDGDLDGSLYTLALGIEITYSDSFNTAELIDSIEDGFYTDIFTNRRREDIVSIIMTGVTAMTRQVASVMDANGVLYPAEKISDILLDADITHISNEVSFVEDCYAGKPNTMVFCSKPEYMELLKSIDTDVIELTGNHIIDYGREWFEYTIEMYEAENIPYFGGGRNLEDALVPAFFEINGYKFAFIGANSYGPASSWATGDLSGSAPVNTLDETSKEEDMQKFEKIIEELTSEDYNVIFTFQYQEVDTYKPTTQQIEDFKRMSEAGAVVVSGSQAHIPQGVEISKDGFINYGLGNLFFGQNYPSGHSLEKPVRQGIITKHIFYKGELINSVLVTTLMDEGEWQPRPTEGQERAELLEAVFNASVREPALE